MCLYQYLIAVRQGDGQSLTNENGEITSHLSGMFYRTLRLVESGIKPVYVFDGKPPILKGGELEKRYLRKEEAIKSMEAAKETGTAEDMLKFEKRMVRVSKEHNEEAKRLLKLMGIPYVEAPCEAEAQCAELARGGKVFAAASEDMDTLCYSPPFLLRHLTFSEARKIPIDQIDCNLAIDGFELDKKTFIDLCILLGCDYCETIKGVGPVTALKLIRQHGSIENIVKWIEENPDSKYKLPEVWPFEEARELFLNPDVTPAADVAMKWINPDLEGLLEFMVKEKGFSEDRIKSGVEKLKKGVKSGVQGRLDGFFKAVPKDKTSEKAGTKRKGSDKSDKSKKKRK